MRKRSLNIKLRGADTNGLLWNEFREEVSWNIVEDPTGNGPSYWESALKVLIVILKVLIKVQFFILN